MMARVLVLDDDDAVRESLLASLRMQGIEAQPCARPDAVVEEVRDGAFDLLITDIVMPQVDGLEVVRDLRAAKIDVRIIAISGDSTQSPNYLRAAKLFGADAVLEKPIAPERLIQEARRLLDADGTARA
ncbi:MAG: response regulator [Alphaproteobacteria bacterium]|nr:response regulator [Alphaproteobacteria bacterium]